MSDPGSSRWVNPGLFAVSCFSPVTKPNLGSSFTSLGSEKSGKVWLFMSDSSRDTYCRTGLKIL